MKHEKSSQFAPITPRRAGCAVAMALVGTGVVVGMRDCLKSDSVEPPKPSQWAPQSSAPSPRRIPRAAASVTTATTTLTTPTPESLHPADRQAQIREACEKLFRSYDAPGGAIFDALEHVRRTLSAVEGKQNAPLGDIQGACAPYIITERMYEILARGVSQGDMRVAEEVKDEMNAKCSLRVSNITTELDTSRCETLPRESPRLTCIKESEPLLNACKTKESLELAACMDTYDAIFAACDNVARSVETRYECEANAREEAERVEKKARAEAKEECLADGAQKMGVDPDQLNKNWGIAKAAKLFAAHTNIMGADQVPSVDESVEYAMLLHSLLFISDDTEVFKVLAVKDRQGVMTKYVDSIIEKFAHDQKQEAKRFVKALQTLKLTFTVFLRE